MPILIEAAVESLDAVLAAVAGGANRLELCTDLAHGGTTPDLSLLPLHLPIPVFVLVRPRAGDFVYTDGEHHTMLDQIARAKSAGARGIVTGDLSLHRTRDLIAAARPLAVTFHRAFDVFPDPSDALERLIDLGVERVLTSGGAPTAPEGAEQIRRLVAQAKGRIGILPGGGIDATNVARLVRETGVNEVHFSVRDVGKVKAVLRSLVKMS
jgi:copper homeostasis protein